MTVLDRPHIDYAPPPPMHRRRRFRRLLVASILAAILLLMWKAGPPAWRHAQILYWQHKAMTYSPPADLVVYDNDPANAAQLLKDRRYRGSGSEAFLFAEPWDRMYQLMSPPGGVPAATLFLHERWNSKGKRRLVAIEARTYVDVFFAPAPASAVLSLLQGAQPARQQTIRCDYVVINPATAIAAPVEIPNRGAEAVLPKAPLRCRWYAGQPDPSDASHFTIRCDLNGKPITVDGWLMDDDTVKLEPRG